MIPFKNNYMDFIGATASNTPPGGENDPNKNTPGGNDPNKFRFNNPNSKKGISAALIIAAAFLLLKSKLF
jgi:hypothetical protein